MLALLSASLLFTAIIVQKSYAPENNLDQSAQTLEHNLNKKERYVTDILYQKKGFDHLKKLSNDPSEALKFIQNFTNMMKRV